MKFSKIYALSLVLAIVLAGCTKGCGTSQTASTESGASAPATNANAPAATPGTAGGADDFGQYNGTTQLKTIDLKVGSGAEAVAGKRVTVDYTGWLTSGKKFDSSVDRNQKFPFTLGAGQVIRGWDQGVAGMKVGGKRRLVIPPDMGYGPNGTPDGTIPPNSVLVFDVELFDVQ